MLNPNPYSEGIDSNILPIESNEGAAGILPSPSEAAPRGNSLNFDQRMQNILSAVMTSACMILAASGCSKGEKTDSSSVTQVSPEDLLDHGEYKSKFGTLFEPRSVDSNIKREQIPQFLSERIPTVGRVFYYPENYNPQKPNFYIICHKHYNPYDPNEENPIIAETQQLNIETFHLLREMGVERQVLEGVGAQTELIHNKEYKNNEVNENPYEAMPNYEETGRIGRAHVAIEGIYGDQIQSIGVDGLDKFQELINQNQLLQGQLEKRVNELYPQAVAKLGLPPNVDSSEVQKALKRAEKLIIDELSQIVLGDPIVSMVIQAAYELEYYEIRGRDVYFSKQISQLPIRDTSMLVGLYHARGLRNELNRGGQYNVFILVPRTIPDDLIERFPEDYTLEMARKIAEHNLLVSLGILEGPPIDYLQP